MHQPMMSNLAPEASTCKIKNLCRSLPRAFDLAIVFSTLFATSLTALYAQVNVTTTQNDIGRTGQNLSETILTPSNVNSSQFGKLFSQPVDGQIYAQPLYLSGLTVNGTKHNVVFIATENDSVYAFDADSNSGGNSSPLWHASLLSTAYGAASSATAVPSYEVGNNIEPQIGITGTPVIDPNTGTLYVVSSSIENGSAVQRLHALSVSTGAEKFGGPAVIAAAVNGTGSGSVGGRITFDSLWELNRPGLLLLNGIVYLGFSSHGDNGPWHGWILGYNASTLKQTGAYCASPNGTGSGFWMSGAGLAADQVDPAKHPYGRMFVPTGNGDYNATKPYSNSMDYGDTHLGLDLTNGVPTVTDEFTTNQQATLNAEDGDIGAGGLMVVPDQSGSYPHLAVQTGKGATLYLLNRDNLGGYDTTKDQALQELPYSVGEVGAWSSPAYWNGNVYYWGRVDYLKSFALVNGVLSPNPTKSTNQYGYPGATPSISANGSTQGIVWSINSDNNGTGPAILEAHNATNVASMLYSSSQNTTRDTAGIAVKFSIPTIANGKVFVGTADEVDVYGLLNTSQQTATPTIAPGSKTFTGTLTVTISDATAGAAIYYTTNGSTATTSSTRYTAPITISGTETINAVAIANGLLLSTDSSSTYTLSSQVKPVSFSVAAGTYSSAQSVALSVATPNATIYYTTDGTTPTSKSTVYSQPIAVAASETISAIAYASGLTASPVTSAAYVLQTGIAFSQGFATSTGLMILNGSTDLDDTRLQLTNGLPSEAGSAWFHTPVNISAFTTTFSFQLSNPSANGFTFAIQNSPQNVNALGGNGYSLGYGSIPTSLAVKFDLYNSAGEGSNSTGLYINGAVPTVPAINLISTGINLHSDDTMNVNLTYNGTTLSMTIYDIVTAVTWSTSWTVNIPATIGSSTAYVGFTGSTGGLTASQKILSWTFTSTPTPAAPSATPKPTFSLAAGTYTGSQSLALGDAAKGSTIYYTTNRTNPTTSSTVYTGPIVLSASADVCALAVASGQSASGVACNAYTINSVPPVINFAGGLNATDLNLFGATITNGVLQLTDGKTGETRFAWYTKPVNVQNFSSTFTFKQPAATAEGFTFALQNAPQGVWAVGGTSQGLGYSGIPSSLAIKFDLYNDAGEGSNSTGIYTAGAMPTLPSVDMTASKLNLHSGNLMLATITYNGTTLTLTLTDTVTKATFTTSKTINISSIVGGNTAYAGFTATTGGLTAIQDILTWTYTVN